MTFLAQGQETPRQEVERSLAIFQMAGAHFVDVPTLLRADVMLELYGEDIRNRAFLVHDGVEGDFVLRPDFTVPIVEAHLETGTENARYAYSGRVWRKRRAAVANRAHSFWQVGIEIFDNNQRAKRDAEIFSLAMEIAKPHALVPIVGDLGLVFSLLDQIEMPSWRRDALKRQFWRPGAFNRLLERYSSNTTKHINLDTSIEAPITGLRSEAMILARINRLEEDAREKPMRKEDKSILDRVLQLKGTLANVETELSELAQTAPVLKSASDEFSLRNAALRDNKVDLSNIAFDARFGRETMEYYDGFVFSFSKSQESILSGGRYDRLLEDFGAGDELSAVGMAYRPEFLAGELHDG